MIKDAEKLLKETRQQRDFVKHKEKGLIKLRNTISSKLYGNLSEFQDPINVEKKM